MARVLEGEIEAAFVAEPFTADGLETQLAFRERLVLITPKSFGRVRTAKDIGHATILASRGLLLPAAPGSMARRSKLAPDRVMEYGSYHAIVACIAAGAGVASCRAR